ncbi:MAG: diguanylate cyclase [Candidatus Omnitrophica bacterium]|nr:diguanylate cyclase [Candidatus Omnitrophota bacterium]
MNALFFSNLSTFSRKILSVTLCLFLILISTPVPLVRAQTPLNLPLPGAAVPLTSAYEPALLRGLTIYPDNPLQFEFLLDAGDTFLRGQALRKQGEKLIKYFLAALTIPEEEMWVNLSPYEDNLIIPDSFGDTTMGSDLLAQDYLLKQLTASLMTPEDEIGRIFWDRIYEKVYNMYKTTDIPLNTFNKIWIVPESATVVEKGNDVYLMNSRLSVMLEEDYVALKQNLGDEKFGTEQMEMDEAQVISQVATELVREIIIPEIEREVNEGQTFAQLRQIYHAMVLSTWYKQNLKESFLGQVYIDQSKTKGVDTWDKQVTNKIYDQYIQAFKSGVQNIIRDEYNQHDGVVVPRKYFSGGFTTQRFDGRDLAMLTTRINLEYFQNVDAKSRAEVRDWLMEADNSELFQFSLSLIEYTENNELHMDDVVNAGFFDNVIDELHSQRINLLKEAQIAPFMLEIPFDQRIQEDGISHPTTKDDLIIIGERFRKGIDRISKIVHRDKLTGLYNLDGYMLRLQEMVDWIRRQGDKDDQLQYVFFDIDHFKAVNDTFGHDNGDIVLQEFAEILSSNVRASTTVARIGGEEFIVMMFDKSSEDAVLAMKRMKGVLRDHFQTQVSKTDKTFLYDKKQLVIQAKKRIGKLLEAKTAGQSVGFDITKLRDAIAHQVKVQATNDAERRFAQALQSEALFNADETGVNPEIEKALDLLAGWMITFSAGITIFDLPQYEKLLQRDGIKSGDALTQVATLLYRQGQAAVEVAKNSGRDEITVFDPETMEIDEDRDLGSYASPAPSYEAHDLDKMTRRRLLKEVNGLRKRFVSLINKSETDPLTGMKNRNGLYQKYIERVHYGARYQPDTSMALAYTDIDFFKTINDSFGHEIGDDVLKALAAGFKENLRTIDTVARFGGEEVIIFLPAMKRMDEQRTILKVRDIVRRTTKYIRENVSLFGNKTEVIKKIRARIGALDESQKEGLGVDADLANLRNGLVHQLTVQEVFTDENEAEKKRYLNDTGIATLYELADLLNGWDVTLSVGVEIDDFTEEGKIQSYLKKGDLDTGLTLMVAKAEIAAGYVKETGRNRAAYHSEVPRVSRPAPNILAIIEKEQDRDGFKAYFENKGYVVTVVGDLESAEGELAEQLARYSFVLTEKQSAVSADDDSYLPGNEVIDRLRSIFPGIKSLILGSPEEIYDVDHIEEMITGAIGEGKTDQAMLTARLDNTPVGGIDLDPALLDLKIKRDGEGIALPLLQQPPEALQIEGFIPVIMNVTPVQTLPIFLGNLATEGDTLAQL